MKNICKWIGLLSIAVTLATMKQGLLISTLVWFGTSVFWIGGKTPEQPKGDPIL
jgi:hypothetical protein